MLPHQPHVGVGSLQLPRSAAARQHSPATKGISRSVYSRMKRKHSDEKVGNVQEIPLITKAFMVVILSKKDFRVEELENKTKQNKNLITLSV